MNQHKPNQSTGVFIQGYSGDAEMIRGALPLMEHHKVPVVVLSPEDAPILEMGGHKCLVGGKNGWGQREAIDRQIAHFRLALEMGFDFYLFHESDSFVLEPELPQYLYDRKDEVFSNEVRDPRGWMPEFGKEYHKPLPSIAMQNPYFMSKESLRKIIEVSPQVEIDPITPLSDWSIVQYCWQANIKTARFHSCCSCDTREPFWRRFMECSVAIEGASFIHGVKSDEIRDYLLRIYRR